MSAPENRLRQAVRVTAAVILGLILASLPFVYYRYGVGRHHARHTLGDVPPSGTEMGKGVDHASHPR